MKLYQKIHHRKTVRISTANQHQIPGANLYKPPQQAVHVVTRFSAPAVSLSDPLPLSITAQLMQAHPMGSHLALLFASLTDTLIHIGNEAATVTFSMSC